MTVDPEKLKALAEIKERGCKVDREMQEVGPGGLTYNDGLAAHEDRAALIQRLAEAEATLEGLRSENQIVRRSYSGLLALVTDVSRDPLNAKCALALELLATGIYADLPTEADQNSCGIWCPNCGAHLREPDTAEASCAAHIERVARLEANQRTPGTVEVCGQQIHVGYCSERMCDARPGSAMAASCSEQHCPLRLASSPTTLKGE